MKLFFALSSLILALGSSPAHAASEAYCRYNVADARCRSSDAFCRYNIGAPSCRSSNVYCRYNIGAPSCRSSAIYCRYNLSAPSCSKFLKNPSDLYYRGGALGLGIGI